MNLNIPIEFSINEAIDSRIIHDALGLRVGSLTFEAIGDVHSCHRQRILSYVKAKKYIEVANANKTIAGIFCGHEVARSLRSDIIPIIVDDPNWAFFKLLDHLACRRQFGPNKILSKIDSRYNFIDERGIYIGRNTTIGAFSTIHAGAIIGDGVLVRPGAVLALDTFQHQRISSGIISPRHDGLLYVQDGVEIGANATISIGFSYRPTQIGESSKIDAGVYIGHGVQIGKRAIICAGAKLMGHCKIGDDTFVGPGAIVSSRVFVDDRARISLGAVVTRVRTHNQNMTVAARIMAFMKTLGHRS